ncbi:uncharacterized protein LOC101855368 [Aplysia californica]|uniref:Uncharacterized protein LOC101855368 n=1 Tax=Aplysia californica TaxID=6500 RepID=A0ABM1A8V9_APLCA|nr:uncharacterized protein LOC101855368 [Aplysia californica]
MDDTGKNTSGMAWFQAFRNEHGFTSYPDNRTPVTVDMPLLAVTYMCVLIAIATIIATLGIRGRERWSSAIRASYAVAIGSIILVCIFGHGWQEGQITVTSPYVYRSNLPFEGRVAVHVALHGTNVTLEGYYQGASGSGYVYFVESLPWADYGHEPERFDYYLQRGLPEPILKVMEFLTVDEGGLRWGRSFHTAGHYGGVLLWTAFAFWMICNVLLFSVVIYGAYMFALTGVAMILACVAYHSCQNGQPLAITFSGVELTVSYGWCYWLTLVAGSVTFVMGVTLIILDHFLHDGVAEFFHLERLDIDDYLDHSFKEERSASTAKSLMDRRASLAPSMDMRRNSIFLEPGRRPSWYSDNLRRTVNFNPTAVVSNGISNSGFEADKNNKMNPIYNGSEKGHIQQEDYNDKEIRIDMERVCTDSEVCMSLKKPSLATLKEHRDNHTNERISSVGSVRNNGKTPSSPEILVDKDCQTSRGAGHKPEVCVITLTPAEVYSNDCEESILNNTGTSESQISASEECTVNNISKNQSQRMSTVSLGFQSCPGEEQQQHKQSGSDVQHVTEFTISDEAYNRQSSQQSNASASSTDSGQGTSDEKGALRKISVPFTRLEIMNDLDSSTQSEQSNRTAQSSPK